MKINYELQEIEIKKEAIISFLLRIKEIDSMNYKQVNNRSEIMNELKKIKEIVEYYLTNGEIEKYLINNQYEFTNYWEYNRKITADLNKE